MMRSTINLVSVLSALTACTPATAQSDPWRVVHDRPADMCTATAQMDGDVVYGVSAEGPDFVFKMRAPDFPKETRSYEAALTFKGLDSGSVAATGVDGMMAISLGRGELAQGFVKASELSLEVEGHRHSVTLAGAAEALDQVAHCAKQPTLAEAPEKPPLPIPGAGEWTLYETLPYQPGRACLAHLDDPEVDTMLGYDEKGTLELTGGNPIWAFPVLDTPMQISIDGGPDLPLKEPAHLAGHTFSLKIDQLGMIEQLRQAKIIDWIFPKKGSLRSQVAGLGVALDAVQKCRAGGRI